MPGATTASEVVCVLAMPTNATMMPHTVPNRPMNGAFAPIDAKEGHRGAEIFEVLVLTGRHRASDTLHGVVARVAHRVEAEVLRAADFRHASVEHRLDAGSRQLADDGFGFFNRIGLAERAEEFLAFGSTALRMT